jgi:hypothetical protein
MNVRNTKKQMTKSTNAFGIVESGRTNLGKYDLIITPMFATKLMELLLTI